MIADLALAAARDALKPFADRNVFLVDELTEGDFYRALVAWRMLSALMRGEGEPIELAREKSA